MKRFNSEWALVVILTLMSCVILGVAGYVAGKPITIKTSLVRVVDQAGNEQCRTGLEGLGLSSTAPGSITVAKQLGGSLREGALEVALALQACPSYQLKAACVGERCLNGQPGVSLTLEPRVIR